MPSTRSIALPPTDPRAALLTAFDAHASAFSAAAERAIGGGALAQEETAGLTELAAAIATSLAGWGRIVGPLNLARRAPFDAVRAGTLLLESVFDDLLTPDAWLVLSAAVELAPRATAAA